MGYLISAYFDTESNRTLERYIGDISKNTGNGFMTEKISLCLFAKAFFPDYSKSCRV